MHPYKQDEIRRLIKQYVNSPEFKKDLQRKVNPRAMLKKEIQRRIIHLTSILKKIEKDEEIPR
jgi:hypothetical protein